MPLIHPHEETVNQILKDFENDANRESLEIRLRFTKEAGTQNVRYAGAGY
ncbi:hypothetical protein MBOE_47590 [Mycolicibacterium boenickei]|nr:hypothetical protein MBOE_47590 [Mycolicibacterium boenickei]